ncbi:hypothetical protein FE257_010362 [Aspergillus nanangensis]|uniref:F-box domain-containing protein n=1 Tax=Aspergillus nanangensis TaxID=2582783 RepID=A0AAD4GRA4_ASPNN|nr:hypothetical protein FE257_010362 [Aspergillus nanangensis]
MALLSAPREIRELIISYVSSIDDLAALSQSCRAMYSICDMKARRRFHKISVYPNDTSINETFDMLMEVLRRPSLGKYVRELQQGWRPSRETSYVEMETQRDLPASDMDLLQTAVQKAGFVGSEGCTVLNMLMQDSTDVANQIKSYSSYGENPRQVLGIFITQALAAMLMSVSPELESLAMTQPFAWHSRYANDPSHVNYPLVRLLRLANADPANVPFLRNLRNVYIIVDEASIADDDRFYIFIHFMDCTTLFSHLPSIESIATDALFEGDDDGAHLAPQSSQISRIRLTHCALGTPYLASLIMSCQTLREFQYTIGGRAIMDGTITSFNNKTLIKSIIPHKDTLQVLDIDAEAHMFTCDSEYNECYDEDRVGEFMSGQAADDASDHFEFDDETRENLRSLSRNTGSLKEFCALTRLSVGIGFLMDFAMGVGKTDRAGEPVLLLEALPESLEYLCIRGYERWENTDWDTQIDALMTSFRSGSSGIKEILGVEETINNSKDVKYPDDDPDSLWSLEDSIYAL